MYIKLKAHHDKNFLLFPLECEWECVSPAQIHIVAGGGECRATIRKHSEVFRACTNGENISISIHSIN